MTYREWLRLNTAIAEQFHHQTLRQLDRLSLEQELDLPPRQYLWVNDRLVIIDTERYRNFWCLI